MKLFLISIYIEPQQIFDDFEFVGGCFLFQFYIKPQPAKH